MSASQDAQRLLWLTIAHGDAVSTLVEHVEAGTATRWDAKAVTTALDAVDATRHAFKLAHYPTARAIHVDAGVVIVRHNDDRLERVSTDDEDEQ